VDRERMHDAAGDGFATATSLADVLVRRGLAFRVAHGVVGRLVAAAEAAGTGLDGIPDSAVRAALDEADDDAAQTLARDGSLPAELRAAASIEVALAGADVIGGTAPARVNAALAAAKERLGPA
jgi:argininosuccinate lyase